MERDKKIKIRKFTLTGGSDERQYSSQGFRINVATICKDKYYEYPFYHTSLDNLDFVKSEQINQTLMLYLGVIEKLEQHSDSHGLLSSYEIESETLNSSPVYRNLYPNCEVMLSKHGLYSDTGGGMLPGENKQGELDIILLLLFHCDGKRSISSISRKLKISLGEAIAVADMLKDRGILERVKNV